MKRAGFLIALLSIGILAGAVARAGEPLKALSHDEFLRLSQDQQKMYVIALQHISRDFEGVFLEKQAPKIKGPRKESSHFFEILDRAYADENTCIYAGHLRTWREDGFCSTPAQGSCAAGQIACYDLLFGNACTQRGPYATSGCMRESADKLNEIIAAARGRRDEWNRYKAQLDAYCASDRSVRQRQVCAMIQRRLREMAAMVEGGGANDPATPAAPPSGPTGGTTSDGQLPRGVVRQGPTPAQPRGVVTQPPNGPAAPGGPRPNAPAAQNCGPNRPAGQACPDRGELARPGPSGNGGGRCDPLALFGDATVPRELGGVPACPAHLLSPTTPMGFNEAQLLACTGRLEPEVARQRLAAAEERIQCASSRRTDFANYYRNVFTNQRNNIQACLNNPPRSGMNNQIGSVTWARSTEPWANPNSVNVRNMRTGRTVRVTLSELGIAMGLLNLDICNTQFMGPAPLPHLQRGGTRR